MKVYRRHEDGAAAAAPEESLKTGAVAGAVIVVTLLSKVTTDAYEVTKSLIGKGAHWIVSKFQ